MATAESISGIVELELAQYARVRPLTCGCPYALDVCSLLDGNTRGRVWADDPANPQTVLAWVGDKFFLAGHPGNQHISANLNRLIDTVIAPEAARQGLAYFAAQVFPLAEWERTIGDLLGPRGIQINYEWKSTFRSDRFLRLPPSPPLPSGFTLRVLERTLLAAAEAALPATEIKRAWVSVDRFLEKGMGFCIVAERHVSSYCLSLRYSAGAHQVAVNTPDSACRNRGLATAAARAFITACLARGETPVWTADRTNAPSIAIADKLGFERVGEYPVFYFAFA